MRNAKRSVGNPG
jgi:hypothetical protein